MSYVHPNSQGGIDWKINGFCIKDFVKDESEKEYYETLDLFITFYKNEYDYNITKDDFTKSPCCRTSPLVWYFEKESF